MSHLPATITSGNIGASRRAPVRDMVLVEKPEVLTAEEVAERLKVKVSWVHHAAKQGRASQPPGGSLPSLHLERGPGGLLQRRPGSLGGCVDGGSPQRSGSPWRSSGMPTSTWMAAPSRSPSPRRTARPGGSYVQGTSPRLAAGRRRWGARPRQGGRAAGDGEALCPVQHPLAQVLRSRVRSHEEEHQERLRAVVLKAPVTAAPSRRSRFATSTTTTSRPI